MTEKDKDRPYYDPTPEQRRAFEQWRDSLPELPRAIATVWHPYDCYRSTENRGHYTIASYSDNGTVRINHGRDSHLPGVSAFGIDPNTLTVCGCKQWEAPTPEQIAQTRRYITQRSAIEPWDCDDPKCTLHHRGPKPD